MTMLGLTFIHTLSFAPHIFKVTGKAAASLYALKTLKARGLHGRALCDVTQATLVALRKSSMVRVHQSGQESQAADCFK